MSFELKLALRFLKNGKIQTTLIICGIAIGVAVQIFLGALITSLQDNLIENTIGNSAHITIREVDDGKYLGNWTLTIDQLSDDQGIIKAISPMIQGTALIRGADKNKSIQIKGIQQEPADIIYEISDRLIDGNPVVEGNSILIGTGLATDLGVTVGDVLKFLMPSGETVPFVIGGVFDLQNESVNESLVFMELKRAQKLFKSGNGVSAIEVQLEDPFSSDVVAQRWRNELWDVRIDQWQDQNKQLLSALSSQSSSSYTIQFFVVLAVTLGIASVLAVSAVQKTKEIGILKAMGTTSRSASIIFIMQGLILGLIGAAVGCVLGILLLTAFNMFSGVTFTIVYNWKSILIVTAISVAAATLASVIPARRSANLNPMEAIKNG